MLPLPVDAVLGFLESRERLIFLNVPLLDECESGAIFKFHYGQLIELESVCKYNLPLSFDVFPLLDLESVRWPLID